MKNLLLAVAIVSVSLLGLRVFAKGWEDDRRNDHGNDERRLPLIAGHRGATGYLPEHTLASYELAILRGADYIEPDLVSTKDGVLIARHEVDITQTTDVANHPEFASKMTTKTIDGVTTTGWFADDFTLAQIKTLRATQRVAFRPQEFNSFYEVPTLEEVIRLAQSWSRKLDKTIGVYPETKHPTYHTSVGLQLEDRLLSVLAKYGLTEKRSAVIIQSFEVSNLKYLRTRTRVKIAQLVDALDTNLDGSINSVGYGPYDFKVAGDPRIYPDLVTNAGLAEIKRYADIVAPWKRYIVSVAGVDANKDGQPDDINGDGTVDDSDKHVLPITDLIDRAHAAGLLVHSWTFRNERRFLGLEYGENPSVEYLSFFCNGLDGLFSDFPDTAVSARTLLVLAPRICDQF